jgi:hypothetical protein
MGYEYKTRIELFLLQQMYFMRLLLITLDKFPYHFLLQRS